MAVFSNDPRAQALWNREKMLNLITSRPCDEQKQVSRLTDICRGDDDKRRRLGYSGCLKNEFVENDCQDYNRNVKAKAETSAELAKYLKDTAKAKADKDKKEAEFAAEQAILARRRAANASLEKARVAACGVRGDAALVTNVQEPRRTALLEACQKARVNEGKNRVSVDNDVKVTFDEVARELATSKAGGKKPAKLKAKAKAKAKAAAKLKKKNR